MDALLSPRRRTLLQALGAACAGRRLRRAPATGATARPRSISRGATMGSHATTSRSPAPRSRRSARPRRAAAVEAALDRRRRRGCRRYDAASELSRFNAHALDRRLRAVGRTRWRCSPLAAQGRRRDRRRVRRHRRAAGRRLGLRPGAARATSRAAERVRGAAARASVTGRSPSTARAGTATKALPTVRGRPLRHRQGLRRRRRGARARSARPSPTTWSRPAARSAPAAATPTGRPWQIGIERPDAVPQRAHFIVPLSGQSMATSGDYRIFFEQGRPALLARDRPGDRRAGRATGWRR